MSAAARLEIRLPTAVGTHLPASFSPTLSPVPANNTPAGTGPWVRPTTLKPTRETGLVQLLRVPHGGETATLSSNGPAAAAVAAAAVASATESNEVNYRGDHSFHLRGKPWITVGRSEKANVRLDHPTASRWHAALLHCDDGQLYVIDCCSGHGTSTGGAMRRALASNVPTPVPSGTLLQFGDSKSPLYLVKYCTKRQLLGTAAALQAAKDGEGSSLSEEQIDDNPLSPHTMINTQLNAVLPSFTDSHRRRVKRLLTPPASTAANDDAPASSSTTTSTTTRPISSPMAPSAPPAKRVCFGNVRSGSSDCAIH